MIPISIIDAFTDRPFAGNPAAVCPLDRAMPDAWMQAVANEMNLAETAFIQRIESGWSFRWFTPTVEVDLCGHATLAAAHYLWETHRADPSKAIPFQTRSGPLIVTKPGDGYEMDFPALPVKACDAPADLSDVLGANAQWVGQSSMDLFVVLADESSIRKLNPDLMRLAKYPVRGVIVTSRSSEYDFVSRFFAPQSGVPEDPVTGSAHCALAMYWSAILGKNSLTGYQASKRGGVVKVTVRGDRVILGGNAVTVMNGQLEMKATSAIYSTY